MPGFRSTKGLLRLVFAGLLLAAFLIVTASNGARAATCSKDDFGAAVDEAGQRLRQLNDEQAPKIAKALNLLKTSYGWTDEEMNRQGQTLAQDARTAALDEEANGILSEIDTIADQAANAASPDCRALAVLRDKTDRLIATIGAKWSYSFERMEAARIAAKSEAGQAVPDNTVVSGEPAKSKVAVAQSTPRIPEAWTTSAEPNVAYNDPPVETAKVVPLPPTASFSIDQIQGASKGFFGIVSKGLAGALEQAFQKFGRPNGYILGNDGGGSFLAGLRYGKGRLQTPLGSYQVFWHGPSIGLDFGAEGSKTMMLVYNLDKPADIISEFSGIGGSAYVVGGVGMTYLGNGRIVIAPIRSGIGLRLGASLGYLKFTTKQTWLPF